MKIGEDDMIVIIFFWGLYTLLYANKSSSGFIFLEYDMMVESLCLSSDPKQVTLTFWTLITLTWKSKNIYLYVSYCMDKMK